MFVLTIYGCLLPFNYTSQAFDQTLATFLQIGVIPTSLLGARGDWVVSAVQFSIFGFVAMAAVAVDRPARVGWLAALLMAPACMALAIGIEFLQICFPPRTVSVNDIFVETLGGFAGIVAWLIWGQQVTAWLRRLGGVSDVPLLASRLIPGYIAAILIAQLMPFDFVVGRHELAVKYQEGKIQLLPFQGPWHSDALLKTILNMACFYPLGLLEVAARRDRSQRGMTIPWLALAMPWIVELLQVFVYSRSANVTDIATGMVGAILGGLTPRALIGQAGGSATPQRSGRDFTLARVLGWSAALVVWFAIVVYFNWRPFNFTVNPSRFLNDPEDLSQYGWRRMAVLPFVDYYWGNKYNALDQFLRKGLSFLPLGALFALAATNVYSTGGSRRVFGVAVVAGIIIEIGRYFLPDRNPSVTDILIGCAGALIGFWFVRYVRATVWAENTLYGGLPRRKERPAQQASSPLPHANNRAVFFVFRQ